MSSVGDLSDTNFNCHPGYSAAESRDPDIKSLWILTFVRLRMRA